MTSINYDALIVGAGIAGITTALELNERGYSVGLLDPGPLPHPLAASTDISKAVRVEYGPDEDYMRLAEAARDGWRQWNTRIDEPLYHEVGVIFLSRGAMNPGGFEYESYQLLLKHGAVVERLGADDVRQRFPSWNANVYTDGFFDPAGGYVQSGPLLEALLKQAEARGVTLLAGQDVTALITEGDRVTGVQTRSGDTFNAGEVIVAAGAWTPYIVPELKPVMRAVGHPVFHVQPPDVELFRAERFPVFAADIANTGWYGFPLHPQKQVVKCASHGVGVRLHPTEDERVVNQADEQNFRAFLSETFPVLAAAPITYTRRCLYCDTLDEHFWIGRSARWRGLSIAAGDSGHGFKFAPLWGGWVADALEDKPYPSRFHPRPLPENTAGEEAARYHG